MRSGPAVLRAILRAIDGYEVGGSVVIEIVIPEGDYEGLRQYAEIADRQDLRLSTAGTHVLVRGVKVWSARKEARS